MSGFCKGVGLAWGGSVTNRATLSCFYFFICFVNFVHFQIKLKSYFVDFITSNSLWGTNLPSPVVSCIFLDEVNFSLLFGKT